MLGFSVWIFLGWISRHFLNFCKICKRNFNLTKFNSSYSQNLSHNLLTPLCHLAAELFKGMNLPKDGTKGHFSRSERSKFATLFQFWHLKICLVTFSLFWHEAFPGWDNELGREGLFSRSERSKFVIYLGQYLRNGTCCDQCLYQAHIYAK